MIQAKKGHLSDLMRTLKERVIEGMQLLAAE